MSVSQSILFVLMVLTAVMVYLTYSPLDKTNFWIYWVRIDLLMYFQILCYDVTLLHPFLNTVYSVRLRLLRIFGGRHVLLTHDLRV
jgi:hypothetical protein